MLTLSSSLDSDNLDRLVLDEGVESTDRVTSTSDASDDGIGQPASQVGHLRLDFVSDDGLEVSDDRREGSGTNRGTDEVVSRREVRDPVSHSFVYK